MLQKYFTLEIGSTKIKIKNWNKICQSYNIRCLWVSERVIFYPFFILFILSKDFQFSCIISKWKKMLALKNKYKNILYVPHLSEI